MGFIANLANAAEVKGTFPGQNRSRAVWREVFGGIPPSSSGQIVHGSRIPLAPTTAEADPHNRNSRGDNTGGWGRSATQEAGLKRLLQAMRSMAPGGWSDDRYEQTLRHFNGIAYVAINAIGRQLAQSEFQVFRRDPRHPDGKRPVHEDEEEYRLVKLLERPNPQDSFGMLIWRWAQQLYLTGTALTWIVPSKLPSFRENMGMPMELYSVPTAIAIPQPCVNPDYPDGYYRIQPLYPYGPFSTYPTPTSAVGAAVPAQWMMRFQFPHPLLRYEGYSPLTGLRLHLDAVEMMDKSRHSAMRREFKPSAVLNMDGVEGTEHFPEEELERVKEEFANAQLGTENVGKLFVSYPGARLDPWGIAPKDMDYTAGWEQLTSFALGGFGITKPAAGMVEDSSYATLFATLKQLHLLTIQPDADLIAADLTRHLAPFYGDDLIIEIRAKRIDDHDVTMGKINILIGAQAIKKNEVRELLDQPLTREPWGDEFAGQPSAPAGMEGNPLAALMGGMGGAEGGAPGGAPPAGMPGAGGQPPAPGAEETQAEPAEIAGTRETPGNLSRGALGPRKSLPVSYREVRKLRKELGLAELRSLPKPKNRRFAPLPPPPPPDDAEMYDTVKEAVGSVGEKSMYDMAMSVCGNGH